MKKLLVSFLVVFGSVVAQAACFQEAQFIGTVKNHNPIQKSESITECFYQIEYSMFNSSYSCPLVIGEASLAVFQDYTCAMKNGDKLSGVLVKNNDGYITFGY